MAGEVTSITVTEQTLYNLTIVEDDSNVVTVTVPDEIATIEVNAYDVNITMANLGTGLGPFKAKSVDHFLFRSITDDDKTIDTSLQNGDNEIRIKLPDAGISTPDNFTINADSDSSAKIELPGPTVDLSKAKLLTDLDANGQEINDILNATATDSFIGDLRGAVKFRAKAGEDLSKGEAVYISGISGNTPVVSLAKADSATTMPAYGLVFADASNNANVQIIEFGDLKGLDTATDSLELDKPVYVSPTTAGGITATRPTGATHLVQNIGLVNRVHASAGAIKVGGSGRVNDVPNQFSITGDITTTAGTITAPTGDITTVNSTTGNITTVNATDVNSTTGDITTVNSTNVNSTNLDVDTGTIDDLTSTTVDINGGSIDGTTVGATTSSTGRFSTLESASVDINGGAIDGTTIGATTPSTIVTTDLTATTADINAGTIDNTTIGATTPSTIVTTDLTATTADINGGTIDGTVVGGSTPAAVSTTSLVATTADINAGTIDNSVIGGTTPNLGTFTTVNATDVNATGTGTIGTLNVSGDTVLTGNLTVNGTQTTVNTETINLADNNIVLNSNHTGTPTQDGGITIERGTSDDAVFQWNETNDKWEGKVGSSYADLKVEDVNTNTLTATTGDITNMNSSNVDITGGAIDGVSLTNIGAIDGTTIGANTSAAGTFTTVNADTFNGAILNLDGEASPGSGGSIDFSWESNPLAPTSLTFHEFIKCYPLSSLNNTSSLIRMRDLYTKKNTLVAQQTGNLQVGNWSSVQNLLLPNEASSNAADVDLLGGGEVTWETYAQNVNSLAESSHLNIGTNANNELTLNATEGIVLNGDTTSFGDIIPDADNTRSLGSPTKMWQDVYIGPGSLYIDGHKVLGSDAAGQIDITTDTDQSLNITAGAAGTAGDITISSAGNTTSIDDTIIHLGPQNNSGTVNAHGTLEAPDLHVGDLEFAGNKIDNTTSNGNLEIATNGTGYLHLNSADVYVGPIGGAIRLDESSITVSNTDGDLNLAGNGAGLVNINSKSLITDSAGGLTAPILELETDNSDWNTAQLMLKDSNGDAVSIVGQHSTAGDFYQLNYTLDPNNTNGDTSTTNFAGDYYFAFSKNYSDPSAVGMNMDVYGANDGFNLTARGDFGAFPTRYSAKTMRLRGSQVELWTSDTTTPFGNFTETLTVAEDRSTFNNVVKLNNASSDPSGENGDMYYNTTSHKFRGYQNGAWINLDGS